MAQVGDIQVRLGLNVQDFERGLRQAESNLKNVGEGFTAMGEGMAKALTIPLAAIGGIALSGADEVQKSQGKIQASLGLTADEAKEYQNVINNLYKDGLGEGMEEVTNAVATVSKTMDGLKGASKATIQAVTGDVMMMGEVFDADSTEISKAVNSMQNSFDGLSVDQSLDMITKGFQEGLDYSGEFIDSINEYSNQFDALGFSAGEMFTVFQHGAETGAFQLDKVGDLIKEFNIRLSDGTWEDYVGELSKGTQKMYKEFKKTGKGGKELFQAVIGEINNLDTEQEQYMLGQALMGTQFEDLGKKGVNALAYVTDEFGKAEGATEGLHDSMHKDFGSTMKKAFREIQIALSPLGIELAKLVEKYLPPLIEKVKAVGEWFSGLSDKGKLVVIAMAGIAAVLPLVLIGIGSMISSIGAIAGAFGGAISIAGKLGGAFSKLKSVMNFSRILPLIMSPVGLIIAGIVALIAVGVLIWKNWDTISAKASEIWGSITSFFSDTWTSISDGVSTFLSNFVSWFSEKWETVKTKTSEIFNAIGEFLYNWVYKLFSWTPIGMFVNFIIKNWDTIRETTKIIFEMIGAIIRAIFNKIVQVVSPIVTKLVNFVSKHWNNLKTATSNIFNNIKTMLQKAWNYIYKTVIEPVVTRIQKVVSTAWNFVSSVTSKVFNAVRNKVSDVFNGIRSKVSDVAESVRSKVSEKFQAAKKAMTKPIEEAKNSISKTIEKIKGFFSGLKLKIPFPKVPKISVEKGSKNFLGTEIPYPKFKVSWNAKGAIFNGATILGQGQGVAEKGTEAVIPMQHKRYMKPFVANMAELLHDMQGDESKGNVSNHFSIAQLVVREEADVHKIATELERIQRKQQRAKGQLVY